MSKTTLAPSPYAFQPKSIRRVWQMLNNGKRVLFWLATGGGKTHVAAAIVKRCLAKKQRVLFMASGRELIWQARDRLAENDIPLDDIGVLMGASSYGADRKVIVGSVATLSRRRDEWPDADLLVIDEAHHAPARTWQEIASWYTSRGSKVLGLTATPYRRDGKGLGETFDVIVNGPSMLELFVLGTLVKPKVFSIDPGEARQRAAGLRVVNGDYDPKAAARVMSGKAIIGSAISEYEKHGNGLPAVVYGCTREHAKDLERRFKRAGYKTGYVDAETPLDVRDKIMSDLTDGTIQIVANYAVLAEGWNCPAAKVCIMARPTRSRGLWRQIVGRFLRAHKRHVPKVLDLAGNVWRHGLPWDDEDVSLESGVAETGEPPIRHCGDCGAVNPIGACECEECGATLGMTERERREKEEEAGRLAEAQSTEEAKRKERERIAEIAKTLPGLKSTKQRERFLAQTYQAMGLQ